MRCSKAHGLTALQHVDNIVVVLGPWPSALSCARWPHNTCQETVCRYVCLLLLESLHFSQQAPFCVHILRLIAAAGATYGSQPQKSNFSMCRQGHCDPTVQGTRP